MWLYSFTDTDTAVQRKQRFTPAWMMCHVSTLYPTFRIICARQGLSSIRMVTIHASACKITHLSLGRHSSFHRCTCIPIGDLNHRLQGSEHPGTNLADWSVFDVRGVWDFWAEVYWPVPRRNVMETQIFSSGTFDSWLICVVYWRWRETHVVISPLSLSKGFSEILLSSMDNHWATPVDQKEYWQIFANRALTSFRKRV